MKNVIIDQMNKEHGVGIVIYFYAITVIFLFIDVGGGRKDELFYKVL